MACCSYVCNLNKLLSPEKIVLPLIGGEWGSLQWLLHGTSTVHRGGQGGR